MKRKVLPILICFVFLIVSCTENGGNQNSSRGVIGITVMTLNNPYFKDLSDAAAEEAAKYGYEVIVASGDLDPNKQRNQILDFVVKDVDAIILAPVDSKSSGVAVRKSNEMGIPVFTADLATTDSLAHVVAHIATDNYQGGRQAGEAMIEALQPNKKKIIILDFAGAESCIKRVAGFRDEVAEYNEENPLDPIEILSTLPCNGVRDLGFKATSDALQAYPDLSGIFAINDPGALGAVAAIERANKQDDIIIIGFDGQPEGKAAIRDGKIYADPIQFPKQIGRQTVQTAMRYLSGEEVQRVQLIETALYRQEDGLNDPELNN